MDLRGWSTLDLIYLHLCAELDRRHREMGGSLRYQGKPVPMGKARGNKCYPQLFSGFLSQCFGDGRYNKLCNA
jgi:hypothetical protein